MTYEQAVAELHTRVEQSLGAFPARSSLTFRSENAIGCSDAGDAPASGPVNISSFYWVDGLGTSGNERYVDDFIAFWRTQGWRLVRDERPRAQVAVMEDSAGFAVIVQLTFDGSRVSLTGSSPCVPRKQGA
jgi:hypothetical protein